MTGQDVLRVAVVTPYRAESSTVLRQCQKSVRDQSYPCTHILVGDGVAKTFFDGMTQTLHVKLPLSNNDYGNTPRYIGAVLADSYGFDAVAFLDADNWFDRDHILTMMAAQRVRNASLISCKRSFVDLAGSPMTVFEMNEERGFHVDTSCWLIMRRAFATLRYWSMPKEISSHCDRIFLQCVLQNGYSVHGVEARTVKYRTRHLAHYLAAKLTPPPDAIRDDDLRKPVEDYLASSEGIAWSQSRGVSLSDLRCIF